MSIILPCEATAAQVLIISSEPWPVRGLLMSHLRARKSKHNGAGAGVGVELAHDLAVKHAQEYFHRNRRDSLKEVAAIDAHLAVADDRMAMRDRLAFERRQIPGERNKLHRLRPELALEIPFLIKVNVAEHDIAHGPDARERGFADALGNGKFLERFYNFVAHIEHDEKAGLISANFHNRLLVLGHWSSAADDQ